MVNFLQRFVSLQESLGSFSISFETKYKGQTEEEFLTPDSLPQITKSEKVKIFYKDENGNKIEKSELFSVSQYKLAKTEFNLPRNLVALCAKSSVVKPITKKYLKTKTLENNDLGGFYHVILVEGEYLDERVNELRDDFDIPKNSQSRDLFLKNLISFENIYNSVDDIISDMLAPPDWDRKKIVERVGAIAKPY